MRLDYGTLPEMLLNLLFEPLARAVQQNSLVFLANVEGRRHFLGGPLEQVPQYPDFPLSSGKSATHTQNIFQALLHEERTLRIYCPVHG